MSLWAGQRDRLELREAGIGDWNTHKTRCYPLPFASVSSAGVWSSERGVSRDATVPKPLTFLEGLSAYLLTSDLL